MAHVASGSVVRQIGSLFDEGSVSGLSDRQLLDRFVARRDTAGEAAFTALVARHGPMVLLICRRLLGDYQHAEDSFLPRDFRLPIVLCYFEGLPLDEAARQLHWREGTLRSRLARARDKLRRGLTRRGIVVPAAALAAVLDARPVSASISSPLCDITTRAAIDFAAKPAAAGTASALAHEVLRSMLLHKLKVTVLTLLFLGTIASGAGVVGHAAARQAGKPDLPQIAAKPEDVNPKPGPGRMFVVGRVVDPQGKPVPNASVMVYARSTVFQAKAVLERLYPQEFGRAASDGSGRFRVEVRRTSSSRHDEFGAVARAPGYGAGWVDALDPDADQPTANISLLPEQVIRGRLFDLQGQPAPDVKLSVTAVRRVLPKAPNALRQEFEGPAFWWTHPDDLPGWPSPAITGADGRFTVNGVGPGLRVFLSVIDPRFVNQVIEINTDAASTTQASSFALQPARNLTGRVTYADTGKPVPNARVHVTGFDQAQAGVGARPIITTADAQGRFHANPGSGADGFVIAFAPDGQPYLGTSLNIDWPKGAVTHLADLVLPRGVMLRGTVTEQGSGRAVSGAVVTFFPHRTATDELVRRPAGAVESAADGSLALPIPARTGYLVVRAPTDDYVLQELDRGLLVEGQAGSQRAYAHAFIACDPKPGGESQDVKVPLRLGVTVKGKVVAPDGETVAGAWLLSRIHLNARSPFLQLWSGDRHGTARNGQFELHGLDPDVEVPVSFLDPKRKLGATVRFSGKPAGGGPIVVKLEPCATATARLVGPDGKPLGAFAPRELISMVVTPGEFSNIKARKNGTSEADQDSLTIVDPINYPKDPTSDAHGRIVFPALIPGTTYRIIDRPTIRTPNGPQLRKEFTVKPGELLDLGDILIEPPTK